MKIQFDMHTIGVVNILALDTAFLDQPCSLALVFGDQDLVFKPSTAPAGLFELSYGHWKHIVFHHSSLNLHATGAKVSNFPGASDLCWTVRIFPPMTNQIAQP